MDIDFKTWGPMTVLAVAVVLLVVGGGIVEVITTPYTYGQFLDDLKWVAGALGGGAAIGRGLRLNAQPVSTRRVRR
jgi:hypothetical protein